jgi:MAP3K TRAFs-binding domain
MSPRPLCFVLMPFGSKTDPSGGPDIDFDRVYGSAIRPGIEDADMQPIRADEEELGGIIHRAMFERLLVCSYALADLTTSNANVLYELGVRHTARPGTTLTIYARSTPLPFDVRMLRTAPYELGEDNGFAEAEAAKLRVSVGKHLATLRHANEQDGVRDSPLYELVPAWNPPPLAEGAAESFRADVREAEKVKEQLNRLRIMSQEQRQAQTVRDALVAIRARLLDDSTPDAGLLVKLMLVHRSISDWSGVIDVCGVMPAELARQVPIRQQRAFAYSRRSESAMESGNEAAAGVDRSHALTILQELDAEQGPTSETSGLMGRIYKSQWLRSREQDPQGQARVFLRKALDAYRRGFDTDWRDVYPGINAVTLLGAWGGTGAEREKERLLPVVRFAAEQRLRAANPDYWDHATLLEVLVLMGEDEDADAMVDDVLVARSEGWQSESTAGNLRIIESIRRERGEGTGRLETIIARLG